MSTLNLLSVSMSLSLSVREGKYERAESGRNWIYFKFNSFIVLFFFVFFEWLCWCSIWVFVLKLVSSEAKMGIYLTRRDRIHKSVSLSLLLSFFLYLSFSWDNHVKKREKKRVQFQGIMNCKRAFHTPASFTQDVRLSLLETVWLFIVFTLWWNLWCRCCVTFTCKWDSLTSANVMQCNISFG